MAQTVNMDLQLTFIFFSLHSGRTSNFRVEFFTRIAYLGTMIVYFHYVPFPRDSIGVFDLFDLIVVVFLQAALKV